MMEGGAPACGASGAGQAVPMAMAWLGAALQPGAGPPSAWEKQLLQAQGLLLPGFRDEGTPAHGTYNPPPRSCSPLASVAFGNQGLTVTCQPTLVQLPAYSQLAWHRPGDSFAASGRGPPTRLQQEWKHAWAGPLSIDDLITADAKFSQLSETFYFRTQ